MRKPKREREYKRQRGQYMTPRDLAIDIVTTIDLTAYNRILEPACGDGAFLSAVLEQLAKDQPCRSKPSESTELIGIEIDPVLSDRSRGLMDTPTLRPLHRDIHVNVYQADFFRVYLDRVLPARYGTGTDTRLGTFDLIIGNPPFGGTFDPTMEDTLDRLLGRRLGMKIKKETYAFFIVACLDLLRHGGKLVFICSDTLLTIPTMTGLRRLLMEHGEVSIRDIREFSEETAYPMVVLEFAKGGQRRRVTRNAKTVDETAIYSIPNLSWGITPRLSELFEGPLLRDYFVATSGMTTGKNQYFVREVDEDRRIVEPYLFEFYDAPITVQYETERARLGRLPEKRRRALAQAEARGVVERRLRVVERERPLTIQMPDPRYRPYNKANNRMIFAKPTHYIFWEEEGEAVLTYKRTGNWYLRGVGGQPYFGREGITWPLIAGRFIARYLPDGYILDSGAPCGFVRDGVTKEELFLVLGWLLSSLANQVLKTVINHTRNIQSKDFERMPYPWWLDGGTKRAAIEHVTSMVEAGQRGRIWGPQDREIGEIDKMFEYRDTAGRPASWSKEQHKGIFRSKDEFVLTPG